MATPADDTTMARLRDLAAFADALGAPNFDLGRWVPMEQRPDGVYTMPWFDFSPAALELLRAMPVSPSVRWMDWAQTGEARRLLADPTAVADATPEQLVALATTIVRADRFNEGTVAHFHETGHLRAIVRRAAELTEAEARSGAGPGAPAG